MAEVTTTAHEDCPNCGKGTDCCIKYGYRKLKCSCKGCGCGCPLEVVLPPNRDLCYGTILAYDSQNNVHDAYDPKGANGLNIPIGLLETDIWVDAHGNHSDGSQGAMCIPCPTGKACMLPCGIFETKYIPQYLDQAVATGKFTLLSNGLVKVG